MILGVAQHIPRGTYNNKFVLFKVNETGEGRYVRRFRLRADGTLHSNEWNSINEYRRNSSPGLRVDFILEFTYE